MAVKSKIGEIRKNAGLTQNKLAEAAGISRQAYIAIEAGKSTPSTEISLRLARILETKVEELFWLDDDRDKPAQAELIGESDSAPEGTRIQLIPFGSRQLARPLKEGLAVSHMLNPADAIVVADHGYRQLDLRLLNKSVATTPTLVLGGSDPATSILTAMIRELGVRLVWMETESMPALHALARGEIHIAGCNFKDKVTGRYNLPLVKDVVPFPCTVIRFAVFNQGMMVTAGNPKSIRHIDDLTRRDVTFINRQPGAGSRGLLNRLMWESGISSGDIHGYEKATHGDMATAETVAAGLADCGIGVEAAARVNELDFLLLNEEPYDLVIPNHFLGLPAIQSFLKLLKLSELHHQIESLGGYDTSPMGVLCT